VTDRRSSGFSSTQVAEFETIQSQLDGLCEEIRALAVKRPNDTLNKFKLGVVNGLLRRTNELLGKQAPLEGFEQFSEVELPSNSDVLVVLSQYLVFLEQIRSDNIMQDMAGRWVWMGDGGLSEIRTPPPRKLRK